MLKKWKKVIGLMLSILLVVMLGGCGKTEDKKELNWMTNASGDTLTAYKNLASEFEKENGIKVNITAHGKQLEQLLKARIASKSLPDLFSTHGWSVARYSEYLVPLTNEPWTSNLKDTVKEIMTNEKGELFVLPMTIAKRGLIVNIGVLEKLGIDYKSINSWNEWVDVLTKVKEAGYTPIYVPGKDPRKMAGTMNILAQGVLVQSNEEKLLDGSFDWSNWSKMSNMLLEFKEKGYFNEDILTADVDSYQRAFAQNKAVFGFEMGQHIQGALEYNKDLKLAVLPLPSYSNKMNSYFVGGEREAVGVSKDSKHKKEALNFIKFLAKPESMKKIVEANQNQDTIKNLEVKYGMVARSFNAFPDVKIVPYFDRFYLPSGMWSTLQIVGNGVLSKDITVKEASEIMKKDYIRLRKK